ncbi:hypothetical protein [Noviherbaspirillum sp.]|uniref:hypothetical protein n=1 Tax=Noviherbaspirillum sp. TaxID=1926288 RepID=UPI002B469FEE|nr:hypothetical protein [Noviherbaspirillum sp.]HJV80688.1 hypothetical protein [Noviherbaspirillum sp.]
MKWFYEWRLKRVRAEISALEEATHVKLLDDYTGHSRLRVLLRVAESLEEKLSNFPGHSHASVPASVPPSPPASAQLPQEQ